MERRERERERERRFIKLCLCSLLAAGLLLFGALPAMAQGKSGPHTVGLPLQRPISDFLEVQGTFCINDGAGGCLVFNPGMPNFLLWRDLNRDRRAAVDYAGLAAKAAFENYGLDFGTEITGSVIEQPLSDGTALVKVVLHAKNAFTWVVSGSNTAEDPVIFGNRLDEVAFFGAEPALADVTFRIEFLYSAVGIPLPDLVQMLAFPGNGGASLRSLTFSATALGEVHVDGVPEGAQGAATVISLNNQFNVLGPTVPVSNILVHPGD